jgi:hypothetical protein
VPKARGFWLGVCAANSIHNSLEFWPRQNSQAIRRSRIADLCQKWKTGLSDAANITAFGWNQTEVTATLGAVDAFLTAHAK